MKKQTPKTATTIIKNASGAPLKLFYLFILIAYSLITVVTPNLYTLDSNGPKFLSLSLLNLFCYLFILAQKELKVNTRLYWSFFRNKIGLAYAIFMGIILISFTKAINIPEAIISFSKYFTVFFAAYIISIILLFDRRNLRPVIIVMVFLLITDCISVFNGIFQYITNQISSIADIKSVYSNKNILSSAIFIKVPFALWLLSFEKGWLKKLGLFTLFCAELAILFMSTRAFYLGMIFLVLVYGAFILILDIRNKVVPLFKKLLQLIGTLILSLTLYSLCQHFLYPNTSDRYNLSVTQKLSSISSGESSTLERLESWKRSAILFKQEPLLGVGTGNWKIRVVKYENPLSSDFTFMLKNHNDFIEVTTETGIFGGLFFLSIFAFLLLNFLFAFFRHFEEENSFKYLFLPAFGIFCYSFDAFFNFPADRPEMQSLFAFFIGAGIAFSPGFIKEFKWANTWLTKLLFVLIFILLSGSSYVLLLNFKSLKLQRFVQEDIMVNKLRHTANIFVKGYPSIPNVSALGEPIAVNKSRYLINDGKYQDAINILRAENSIPYLGHREIFMALAFSKLGNNDSALFYAYKAHELKPRYFNVVDFICQSLEVKGKREEAIKMMQDFIILEKTNRQAWLYLATIYWKNGEYPKSVQTIDSSAVYLPGDSTIRQQQINLRRDAKIVPYQQIYSAAMECLHQKKFPEALKYLNEFIGKEPGVGIVYAGRAYCYYYGKEYSKSITDIDQSIALGNDTPDLLNLRGLCYQVLGNIEAACTDFHNAGARGDKDAVINEKAYCKGR